jgi:hypothetical protein
MQARFDSTKEGNSLSSFGNAAFNSGASSQIHSLVNSAHKSASTKQKAALKENQKFFANLKRNTTSLAK